MTRPAESRSPAAPAGRPPARWPAPPSCSSASGRRCGRLSASSACSSVRRAAGPAAPAAALVARRAARASPRADPRACWSADCGRSPRRTTRLPIAGWRSPPGCDHRPLSVLTDRPSRGWPMAGHGVLALWQAHVARAVRSGAPAARRRCRVPGWHGAIRAPCGRRWCWPWSPRWRSPATRRRRGWRWRSSRPCRARPRPPPRSCRRGSRRLPTHGWRRSS